VLISEGVTAINQHCFGNNYSLLSVSIPSTVTELKDSCFAYCAALNKIKIPKSVTSISSYVFRNCNSLKEVDMTEYDYIPTLANYNAFSGTSSALKILVPANLAEEWKAATNWSSYANNIVGVEVNNNG
jgi:hypothetical protein